ncbi:uncharacterized protein LOC141532756 [Cotesia typhae]|uniref:uncharacterized protein LOC141532756 n=1 Tax=Cotesia typhae TaxID=2053667 RepID=UPI003D6968B2
MFKMVVSLLVANLFFVNGSLVKKQEKRCEPNGAKCNENSACYSKSCSKVGTSGAKICSVIPKKDFSTVITSKICSRQGSPCYTSTDCCSGRCFWKPIISSPGMCVF